MKSWKLAFLCSHLARIKEEVELLDAAAADFTEGGPEAERLRLDRAIARLSGAVEALVSARLVESRSARMATRGVR